MDINDFLTEEEQKQYAIEAFKDGIKEHLFKGQTGVLADSEAERILTNISYNVVTEMVAVHLPDYEETIQKKIVDLINNKDLSYHVFREKDAWGGKESLAIETINKAVSDNLSVIKDKINDAVQNFNYSEVVKDEIANQLEEIASSFSKLSDVFYNK